MILTRTFALDDSAVTGRTLEGLAVRWDHPSLVRDVGGPAYREAFANGSATKTIAERGRFPLGVLHPWQPGARTSPIPLGAVTFEQTADGLAFRALVSKTIAGDEALELVNDGALTDVSIGFRAIQNTRRLDAEGPVTVRTEIALAELSLAPVGFGAHDGAAGPRGAFGGIIRNARPRSAPQATPAVGPAVNSLWPVLLPVLTALSGLAVAALHRLEKKLDRVDNAVNHQPADEPTLVERVKALEASGASNHAENTGRIAALEVGQADTKAVVDEILGILTKPSPS